MERIGISARSMLWFNNAAQYMEYMAIFEDAHLMSPTYAHWKKRATDAFESLRRSGITVVKVQASAHEFKAWCSSHAIGLNAEGRTEFATFKAAQQIHQSHSRNKNP